MSLTKCNRCELMCGLIYLPTAAIPKDNKTPLPGVKPDGSETNDIRDFCEANYIEPESE